MYQSRFHWIEGVANTVGDIISKNPSKMQDTTSISLAELLKKGGDENAEDRLTRRYTVFYRRCIDASVCTSTPNSTFTLNSATARSSLCQRLVLRTYLAAPRSSISRHGTPRAIRFENYQFQHGLLYYRAKTAAEELRRCVPDNQLLCERLQWSMRLV